MKTLSFVLLIALCIALPVMGQSKAYHDNPSPSGGGTNTFPFGNAFGNNWRYHMTIPASSLPTTPARFIELAFAPTATATFSVKDFQLRMEHSTTTVLSTTFATNIGPCPINLIDVQGGNYSFNATASTWTPLGATGSFGYDGKRALVIEIRYRGHGTMNQGTTSIRAYTSASNSNRAWANGSYPSPPPPDPYSAPTAFGSYTSGAMRVCLTYLTTNVLLADDQVKIGNSATIAVKSATPGSTYVLAASLGQGPAFQLGPNCTLNLAMDGLFWASILVGGNPFNKYVGQVPATGDFAAALSVPNLPPLIGVCVYHAGAFFGPSLLGCTNTDSTVIM